MKIESLLLALSCLAAAVSPALAATADEGGRITVDISPLRSSGGVVHCSLWKSAEGFPREYKKAFKRTDAPQIKDSAAQCVFTGVEAGAYAISIFHDEDGDGEVKKNLVGIPKEPLGFSNNAPMRTFGPPTFDDAKFSFDGKSLKMPIAPK